MTAVTKDKRLGTPAVRAFVALAITVIATGAVILLLGTAAYDWVKAVHVIAVIAWMAGMLYLPRLFVYHADAPIGSKESETFKVMEYRLMTIIMNPAMTVAWVLGVWLAWQGLLVFRRVVSRKAGAGFGHVGSAWDAVDGDAAVR